MNGKVDGPLYQIVVVFLQQETLYLKWNKGLFKKKKKRRVSNQIVMSNLDNINANPIFLAYSDTMGKGHKL